MKRETIDLSVVGGIHWAIIEKSRLILPYTLAKMLNGPGVYLLTAVEEPSTHNLGQEFLV